MAFERMVLKELGKLNPYLR